MFPDTTITETEKTLDWGRGMTSIVPKQIKLLADGAIYSQLMQMREPYLDGHHGEWIMAPGDFAKAFRIYWDAGYRIHVHVTGDAGVDMVLDNVEANMRRRPRHDHRTLLAHFSVSQKDQIDRIKRLGVIVSGSLTLFAGTSEGVYRSTDAGMTWAQVLSVVMVRDVEMNPEDTTLSFLCLRRFGPTPSAAVDVNLDCGIRVKYNVGSGLKRRFRGLGNIPIGPGGTEALPVE